MPNKHTFSFDLNENMLAISGELNFYRDGRIAAEIIGEPPCEFATADAEEVFVLAGVGCGLLFIKYKDGRETILCRFSMSGLKAAGEFSKIVNYFINTGTAEIPNEKEERTCPKCDRPLMEEMSVCLFCLNRKGLLSRALKLMKPFRKTLFGAQVFVVVSQIFLLATPLLNRFLIDNYLGPMQGPAAHILFIVGAMLLSRILCEVIFIIAGRFYNRAGIAFANELRTEAYDKLQRISMSGLSKRTPGDLIRRIMDDTHTIKDFVLDFGRFGLEQTGIFLVVFVILLFTNAWLTMLVFLPLPFVILLGSRFWNLINVRYERQWRRNSKCNSILHDIIKGIRTVKAFGSEEREIDKFANETRKLAEVSSSNEKVWALLFPSLVFLTGIGEFLILYFGGTSILEGTLSIGVMVQFTMYIAHVYGPLRWLVSFPRWLAEAMTSMVKVFEILDEEPDIAPNEKSTKPDLTGGVELQNVSFGYKSYEPVLKGINLDVKPGEMIGLVGKSGVGKTTLINLVMRLYDPNIGSVKINGCDLRDIDPTYLHENIGVVFQDTFLFAGTVYENIIYAKPDATPEEVISACKVGGAHDFIIKMPDGYNTVIGESGHTISGGERQRLAIARAVIKNPPILILDEATSSLDVETESIVQESLRKLTKGRATIAIAHRLSTLRSADRLFVLDKNGVAESGTHKELLKRKGIYYDLIMAQRKTGGT